MIITIMNYKKSKKNTDKKWTKNKGQIKFMVSHIYI